MNKLQALKEALAYSRALASLAGDPTMPKGLGPVSVFGGRLEGAGRDLRELFRCTNRDMKVPLSLVAVTPSGVVTKQAWGQ